MFTNRGDHITPPSAEVGWGGDPATSIDTGMDPLSPSRAVVAGGEANLVEEMTRAVEYHEDLFHFDETELHDMRWLETPMVCSSFI